MNDFFYIDSPSIYVKFAFLIILYFILNKIFISKKIFLNKIYISTHKNFIDGTKNIPVSGGIFLIISYLFLGLKFQSNGDLLYLLVAIFMIGYCADNYKNFMPWLRISIQTIVVFIAINMLDLFITNVRIEYINYIFYNRYVSAIFTIFCIMVLINGSNFIDGVNILSLGYYLSVFIIIMILSISNNLNLDYDFVKIQIFLITTVLIFNVLNKSLLGDGGIYLLSFIGSLMIISFVNNNQNVSPYFAVLLLWYPCFENLFSITRKIFNKKNALSADNRHLHHLIYLFIKRKNKNANNLTGLLLVLFNILIMLIGIQFFFVSIR